MIFRKFCEVALLRTSPIAMVLFAPFDLTSPCRKGLSSLFCHWPSERPKPIVFWYQDVPSSYISTWLTPSMTPSPNLLCGGFGIPRIKEPNPGFQTKTAPERGAPRARGPHLTTLESVDTSTLFWGPNPGETKGKLIWLRVNPYKVSQHDGPCRQTPRHRARTACGASAFGSPRRPCSAMAKSGCGSKLYRRGKPQVWSICFHLPGQPILVQFFELQNLARGQVANHQPELRNPASGSHG